MPSNLDKVIAALKFLELTPQVREYRGRFFIQKTAFLAQALGMDIKYNFTVCVSGPYSHQLTCDYYESITKIDGLSTGYELSQSDVAVLEKIKACSGIYQDMGLMEATSTAVYLKKQQPELEDEEIFVSLKRLKPHLSDSARIIGLTKSKELLFKPEYLTNELVKETDQWDKIE